MATWQPIETAPKDGRHIFCFLHDGLISEVWWQRDSLDGTEYWQDYWDSEPKPTHWMPLPAPPTTEGEN